MDKDRLTEKLHPSFLAVETSPLGSASGEVLGFLSDILLCGDLLLGFQRTFLPSDFWIDLKGIKGFFFFFFPPSDFWPCTVSNEFLYF